MNHSDAYTFFGAFIKKKGSKGAAKILPAGISLADDEFIWK